MATTSIHGIWVRGGEMEGLKRIPRLNVRPGGRKNVETGMKWNALEEEQCSVARTVAVIGDRWSLLILRDSF